VSLGALYLSVFMQITFMEFKRTHFNGRLFLYIFSVYYLFIHSFTALKGDETGTP
jgi:hypothetical protein